MALKRKRHSVTFIVGHHDRSHCFDETANGELSVTVVGDWMPRSLFGRCYALCAYARMLYLAFYVAFASFFVKVNSSEDTGSDEAVITKEHVLVAPDVIICDQISLAVPIFKWFTNARVIFYCHFPDQLLTKRDSLLKSCYRAPLDWLEEWSTGKADKVLVNSNFTASIFHSTFRSLEHKPLHVVYPSLDTSQFDSQLSSKVASSIAANKVIPETAKFVFLSINRYERKKNVPLAVHALALLSKQLPPALWAQVHLVIAGGHDPRVVENREVYDELQSFVERNANLDTNLSRHVTLLKSCSHEEKRVLLHRATALLYTPENEHFGIVPIEAMYCGTPVIAVASGGPLETVEQDETGFLVPSDPRSFAESMALFVQEPGLSKEMGAAGRRRVEAQFSYETFVSKLNHLVLVEVWIDDDPPERS